MYNLQENLKNLLFGFLTLKKYQGYFLSISTLENGSSHRGGVFYFEDLFLNILLAFIFSIQYLQYIFLHSTIIERG